MPSGFKSESLSGINRNLQKYFTNVSVQRVSHDDMGKYIEKNSSRITETLNEPKEQSGDDGLLYFRLADQSRYRADTAGFLLTSSLINNLAIREMYPNLNTNIVILQKIQNVVYMQSLSIIDDIDIKRSQATILYLRKELIIISTEKDIYIVTTEVPTTEPARQHPHHAWVFDWLNGFKVVIR